MELQQQVTSQEISIKMKDLGITEPSIFYRDYRGSKDNEIEMNKEPYFNPDNVNAYTVAELGEMLPQILKIKGIKYQLFISVGLDKQWFVVYANEKDYHDNAPIKFMMCHHEADARAKMLIYLKENNLL